MSAAEPRTLTELSDYIQSLVAFEHDGGEDGYSASADAMWQAALAAFNLVAREVGATGFQASWAALKFYGEAMSITGPFKVTQLADALYPQYDLQGSLQTFIDEGHDWLRDEARKKLNEPHHFAVDTVVTHWERLAERTEVPR